MDAGRTEDDDRVQIARTLATHGADLVDVSAGGVVLAQTPVYGRMFQVHLSEQIRWTRGRYHHGGGQHPGRRSVSYHSCGGARGPVRVGARAPGQSLSHHAGRGRYGVDRAPWPKQYLSVRRIGGRMRRGW